MRENVFIEMGKLILMEFSAFMILTLIACLIAVLKKP